MFSILLAISTANDCMSSTIKFRTDGEFLGTISSIVRSSTNLVRGAQDDAKSFTITENNIGPLSSSLGEDRVLDVELLIFTN